MAFTLSQLRIFQAVVEHGSLRAAARALDLAQSGVTQQLQSLEATLGATLFTRTNRGIVPTAVGQRLLARSGAILGECEQVEHEIRQLSGAYEGTVTLGLVTEPLIDAFAPVLTAFRARFPKVDVHLRTGTSRMMIGWLRENAVDFAIALVAKQTDTTDLAVTPLHASAPVVVCRSGHPRQHAQSLAELAGYAWVSTRSPNLSADPVVNRLLAYFDAHGQPAPTIIATVEGMFETLQLVTQTDCLALESEAVTRHGPFASALAKVREQAESQEVCLLQRAAVPLTPAAQELATMLASYLRTVRGR
ncbi:LysR family transcriptional regulator [Burkholderia diffusa]|uniref:LysR family transcriptional regulator n=1 Tax=Burkholderia diffusa TaxID=488732 RepID=UPI0007566126|nr:LysR substrate-binding domain-containing protein [Burkholderia diffusa]KUZ09210.1 LysR family transcriptional regulator [Burkholderia diffusa]KVC15038.1 LysR family transcriptional regulator [Burkholderia diffusa]